MEPIPASGLYYPNKIARIALHALEDVMGKNGVNAILNLANLPHLVDNFPQDNLNREFDFAYFSESGDIELIESDKSHVNVSQDQIKVINANLNHFSRYGWIR